jgi:hypothetical protein
VIQPQPTARWKQSLADAFCCERVRFALLCGDSATGQKARTDARFLRFLRFPPWNAFAEAGEEASAALTWTPCELISVAGRTTAALAVLSSELRISRADRRVIALPYDAVDALIAARLGCLEIFTGGCESRVLALPPAARAAVVRALASQSQKVHSDAARGRDDLMRL